MLILTISCNIFGISAPDFNIESEQHFHTASTDLYGAGIPFCLMTRKKTGSVQAAPGRRVGQPGNFPRGCLGALLSQNSSRVLQGTKTAPGCQNSPRVPKQPQGAGPSRAGQGSPHSRALEASAEQWEAANTNFLKVNTDKTTFWLIFPKLPRGNGCPVPINFNRSWSL